MERERDYLALEKKLSLGKSLEQAATEAGMTLEEAHSYLEKRREESKIIGDDALRFLSSEALAVGFETLAKAAREGKRVGSESFEMGSTSYSDIDITAAMALMKAGLEARKILEKKQSAAKAGKTLQGLADLFDGLGPWEFKKSD